MAGIDPYAFTNAFNQQVQLGQQRNAFAAQQKQQALENERAENALALQRKQLGMQEQRFGVEQQQAQQQIRQRALGNVAPLAVHALTIQDPLARKQYLKNSIPVFAEDFRALGSNIEQGLGQLDAMPDQQLEQMLSQVAQFAPRRKGEEAYTLKPGEARFVGGNKIAALPPAPGSEEGGFTLTAGQTRYDAKGRPIATSAPAPDKENSFKTAAGLRNEFNQQSKVFLGVADSYQRIVDSASDPSAAGDLSLIFNYMKVLDPGSTVREGEFATAQNAGGIDARVASMYNRLLNGERLSPSQRTDFVNRATKLYEGQEKRWKSNVKSRYEGLARRYGIDPGEVIVDVNATVPNQGPATTRSGATVSSW